MSSAAKCVKWSLLWWPPYPVQGFGGCLCTCIGASDADDTLRPSAGFKHEVIGSDEELDHRNHTSMHHEEAAHKMAAGALHNQIWNMPLKCTRSIRTHLD